jgi:hypothetical protein
MKLDKSDFRVRLTDDTFGCSFVHFNVNIYTKYRKTYQQL